MENEGILITGVGKRIGLHLALAFLSRGFHVIGTYRRERESLTRLRDLGAELYHCDFYHDDDLARLTDQIREKHKSLRGIIHNASDWLPDNGEEEDVFDKMMGVHAKAPYEINRRLASLLLNCKCDFADIVHFSDYVAADGSAKHIAYAASKAAIENLTLSFAKSLAPKVKVNTIAPAMVLFNDHDDIAYREKTLKKALIPHEGGIEEVVETVFYLFGSRYITGRVIALDGGRHLKRA